MKYYVSENLSDKRLYAWDGLRTYEFTCGDWVELFFNLKSLIRFNKLNHWCEIDKNVMEFIVHSVKMLEELNK